MPLHRIILCTLISTVSSTALAQTYEVVDVPILDRVVGGHETVSPQKEIEDYQETFLKDSLPYTPSINLTENGPPGRLIDFTIRGARSTQNLVLVDDVFVNDPAAGGNADLSNFLNADIERIEILPGPHALAYGPGALGGVVQLIPKRGKGTPSLKATAEGGSFRTTYGTVTGQGEDGPLQFSATVAGYNRGPGTFVNHLHGNRQGDRYRNGTLSTRVGYALTESWAIEGLVRYFEGRVQFDKSEFTFPYLPVVSKSFTDTKTVLASLDNTWGDETWDHSLKATYARTQRSNTSPAFHNKTIGEHPVLLYRSNITINDQHKIMVGLEGGQERAKEPSLHKRNHAGGFVIHTFTPFQTTELKAGVRFDKYQSLDGHMTFNVGVEQRVSATTALRASLGNNFKAPVLSNLFQVSEWALPNPKLKPEKSHSAEAGIDQTFCCQKVQVSLTAFFNEIKNIALSRRLPSGKYQRFNGEKRIAKGLEGALTFKPIPEVEGKIALTATHSRDYPHHRKSPLIPPFKAAGGVQWKPQTDLSFFVQGYVASSRLDSVTKRTISPYGIIHIGGAYDVYKHASFFWRIENLTNKRYEEVYGYGTRGRGFFMGLEAKT